MKLRPRRNFLWWIKLVCLALIVVVALYWTVKKALLDAHLTQSYLQIKSFSKNNENHKFDSGYEPRNEEIEIIKSAQKSNIQVSTTTVFIYNMRIT